MNIHLEEQGNQGKTIATKDGSTAGEMTYSITGSDFIIIDHTEVNPDFAGQGVGVQLLMAVVEMAREKKIKILPLCPFAKSRFDKMPEIRDVLR